MILLRYLPCILFYETFLRQKKKPFYIKAYTCTNNHKPKLGLIEKIKNITKNVKTRVKLFFVCLFQSFIISRWWR